MLSFKQLIRNLNELPSVHRTTHFMFHAVCVCVCALECVCAMAFQFGQRLTFDPPTVCIALAQTKLICSLVPRSYSFLRPLQLIYMDCTLKRELA